MVKSVRSRKAPANYTGATSYAPQFTKTYIGIVKGNTDPQKMGRLQVWIPELSKDAGQGTFWCDYMSPFAGATPLSSLSSSNQQGQQSYGFWAVPPDIDNEVVVLFINGDPNRAVWIGCIYQQFMNSMVPGIPNNNQITTDPNKPAFGPTTEYNKKDPKQNISTDPNRPPFTVLQDALTRQGLFFDDVRGSSSSGARRDTQSNVIGILSPSGNQFVIDDNPDNSFIRFRTKNGCQILVNDTIGNIYFVSKNGNSWMEISDSGIDVYSTGTTSVRAQQDLNFHADKNINMFAVQNININSGSGINIGSGTSTNIVTGNQFNAHSNGSMNLVTGAVMNLASGQDMGINSGSSLALQSYDDMGITSCGDIALAGSKLFLNTKTGPQPTKAVDAKSKSLNSLHDRELSLKDGYPEITTKTNNSRLPTHEPFSGHPTSSTGATSKGIDLRVSTRIEQGDSGMVPPNKSDDIPADASDETKPTGTPGDWWIPTTGRISAPYGDRDGGVHSNGHPGCDIAAPKGSNIIASREGKVIWANTGYSGSGYGGYGNCVAIDHGDGYHSIYGHMSAINVSKGDKVMQGQSIGQVGSTGYSTGNHCHFEIRQNGNRVSPTSFIPELGKKNNHVVAGNSKKVSSTTSNPST